MALYNCHNGKSPLKTILCRIEPSSRTTSF